MVQNPCSVCRTILKGTISYLFGLFFINLDEFYLFGLIWFYLDLYYPLVMDTNGFMSLTGSGIQLQVSIFCSILKKIKKFWNTFFATFLYFFKTVNINSYAKSQISSSKNG